MSNDYNEDYEVERPEVEETETLDQEIDKVVDEKEAEKEAKKEARKQEREEAKTYIREYLKDVDDEVLKKAIILFIGTGQRGAGRSVLRSGINTLIRNALIENGQLTEMEVFMAYKVGRPEMNAKIKTFLKVANADDRIWVKFYPEEEVYKLEGTGAEPPEGWDGFTPIKEEVL